MTRTTILIVIAVAVVSSGVVLWQGSLTSKSIQVSNVNKLIEDASAVEFIYLESNDHFERRLAYRRQAIPAQEALVRLGSHVVPYLIRRLTTTNLSSEKKALIIVLGKIADARAQPILIEYLLSGEKEVTRAHVAWALQYYPNREALPEFDS
jgi:hypothetical protein